MRDGFWDLLSAPFPDSALEQRTPASAESGPDFRRQLRYEAVLERLDRVAGSVGWSNRFLPWGQGLICELSIGEVTKSVLLVPESGGDEARLAQDALVRSAERFGLRAPSERLEPSGADADDSDAGNSDADDAEATEPMDPEAGDANPEPRSKSAGQQAIDRLLERLRAQGQGLAAAQLINRFQGYGSDPEAARELYGQLRALLKAGQP